MNSSRGNSLMYDVIERMDYMVRVMDEENTVIYMNQKMRQEFGDQTGKKCYTFLSAEGKCANCVSADCKISCSAEAKDVKIGNKIYRIIASPVSLDKSEKFSVEIFEDVTEHTKIMEENLKNYEKLKGDVEFAKQIQIRALPGNGEHWNALKVDSCYQPSEALGGDIFDIVKVDERKSLFYIADVSGHGIRASLLTIFLRQVIRGMKIDSGNLSCILDELLKNYKELNMGSEQYFSILIGLYDKEQRNVTFLNAGHNCLPLLVRKDGSSEEISVTGMPVCGLLAQAFHQEVKIQLDKGDKIFLYTDGIVEAYNRKRKQYFGLDGLLQVIQGKYADSRRKGKEQAQSQSLAELIIEEASRFSSEKTADDMAVIIIETL